MEANAHFLKFLGKFFIDFLEQLFFLLDSCFLPDEAVLVCVCFDLCFIYEGGFKTEQITFVQQQYKLPQNILPCLLGQDILAETVDWIVL